MIKVIQTNKKKIYDFDFGDWGFYRKKRYILGCTAAMLGPNI